MFKNDAESFKISPIIFILDAISPTDFITSIITAFLTQFDRCPLVMALLLIALQEMGVWILQDGQPSIVHTAWQIVHIENIDKRECERKSTLMEKEALKRGLNCLLDQGMKIEELTTDAHIAISAMLRTGELICLVTNHYLQQYRKSTFNIMFNILESELEKLPLDDRRQSTRVRKRVDS